MSDQEIKSAAEALLNKCRQAKLMISTAESCTGGLIAAALTSVAGSSQVFTCGMVTYSNKAKMKLLSVPRDLLKTQGAVSIFCARAMAEGALDTASAGLALSSTGIAGPGGGTAEKPVGLIYIAAAIDGQTQAVICQFGNQSRDDIRRASVLAALKLGLDLLDQRA